jgi:hypothetical protein
MEMSVAFDTDQRNVDDCPRSMELGSAENCEIIGALGGAGFSAGGGGGGGGGGGAFFLQPAANIASMIPIQMTPIFRLLLNMNFCLLKSVCFAIYTVYLLHTGC